jgi:hypothetical protein
VSAANPQDPPDEDTFVIPTSWRRILHPRRGGVPAPAIKADPGAAWRLVNEVRGSVSEFLDTLRGDPRVIEQALDCLRSGGAGAVNPLSAAIVALGVNRELSWSPANRKRDRELAAFADEWVIRHGAAFAARAVVEYHDVSFRAGQLSFGDDGSRVPGNDQPEPIAARLRAHLAAATDEEHSAAVAALGELRHSARRRVLAAFLVPDRADWVAEALAALPDTPAPILLCTLGSIDALTALPRPRQLDWTLDQTATLPTLVEGVGPAVAPTLAGWFDTGRATARIRKQLLGALAVLPTDEAFDLLVARLDQQYVRPALMEAMKRYPARAVRLLGKASTGSSKVASVAADLLRMHTLANRQLAEPTAPRVGGSTVDILPRVLASPPWVRQRGATKPVVIDGLVPEPGVTMVWAAGEREAWAAHIPPRFLVTSSDIAPGSSTSVAWDTAAALFDAGTLRSRDEVAFFCLAPQDLVRPRLARWRPAWRGNNTDTMLAGIVARYELDALPLLLHRGRLNPAAAAGLLLPFAGSGVAVLMAEWLVAHNKIRPAVEAWFRRHPTTAARGLVPAALSRPGRKRRAAEAALRLVASGTGAAEVVAVAAEYGSAAADAIEALLATDPLEVLPARMPAIPEWADPALLPPIRRRDGPALPTDAVGHVVTMLALSRPGEAYAGLDAVRTTCDPASLAEFGWALFLGWQSAGLPARHRWVLDALGWIGDDETVRRLAPLIAGWPGAGGHARAVAGLDVLVAIGSDVALTHLHRISERVRARGLRAAAEAKITEVAAALELTPDQLADRLVPDLGLDRDGSLTLDYGPRRFVVGFDEQLKPSVSDQDGGRRKDLPRPGVRDDQDLAAAAYQRFAALKRDARTVVGEQLRRLERAMVWQRRWSVTEFHDLFVRHPLLWHLVRRLVWASFDGDRVQATFRLAEDRTLADTKDDTLALADSARVGIAHPVHLAGVLDIWSALFADYEILQPFPQLDRAVHTLTDDERGDTGLRRFEKVAVPVGRVFGLVRRGWQPAAPVGGTQRSIMRPLAGGRAVVVDLDPGIVIGDPAGHPEHDVTHVWLSGTGDGDWRPAAGLRFGELDAVTASEVLADLTELTT